MKRIISLVFLATLAIAATSRSAVAAPAAKADAKNAKLVAALLAVSPDPLGGELGSSAPTAAATTVAANSRKPELNKAAATAEADNRAYAAWKRANKS